MLKSAEIQAEIDNKNAAIDKEALNGQQTNHDFIIQTRNEISVLQIQLSDAKTEEANQQAQQERVQAQTEKVESITLPLDFNDLLENPLANEMIIEVVKQFQLQAYDEHNAEVERIRAENKSNLDALYARHNEVTEQFKQDKDELKKRIDAENEQAKLDAKEIADLTQQVAQLGLDKQDAEAKRDNAVSELEQAKAEIDRLNSHVFELQQQIASAPAPRQAIDITPNDRLADLAKQAKETAEQKAARGLARWNESNPSLAVAPLEFPVLPTVASSNVEQGNPAERVIHPSEENTATHTEGDSSATGNQSVEQVVAQSTTETPVTGRYNPFPQTLNPDTDIQNLQLAHLDLVEEVNALKAAYGARLDNIERHANLPLTA